MASRAPSKFKNGVVNSKTAQIGLMLRNQADDKVNYKVKKNVPLKKLMTIYCEDKSLDIEVLNFLFNGRRIKGHETPEQLKMEGGDDIQVFLSMEGGGNVGWSVSTHFYPS